MELAKTGSITMSGRIDRKFFHEKYYGYTDWKGERQQKLKRGFATKREAGKRWSGNGSS